MGRQRKRIATGRSDLILGIQSPTKPFGFGPAAAAGDVSDLLTYSGDAHLCTVAPTRSGKGVSVIIPNLLAYAGPVVVIDPKGENYLVTARRRRELGQRVIKLDPFGVVDDHSDSLNPLDLFQLQGTDIECESQAIADLLSKGQRGTKEPFWDLNGTAFSSGLIALAASCGDPQHRNLAHVVDRLTADDIVYGLATALDSIGKSISRLAYREIASVLQMPELTRGGVIATTQSYYKPLIAERVHRTLRQSSFDLQDVVNGKPLSIYLIIPPNRLHSHRELLKLWVGTLMMALFSRRHQPELRTLFVLDEIAQLGTFPLLESLLTLSAGYGVWVHSFWQDLAQLKNSYPLSWRTILNNCAVVQAFGIYNRDLATQWGDYFEATPAQLRQLRSDEQWLSIHGQGEFRCQRVNYLTHSLFQGQFDSNRLYQRASGGVPHQTGPGGH